MTPPREAKNKVTDPDVTDAFLQGVQEGALASRGEVQVFNVSIRSNGVQIRAFQVTEEAKQAVLDAVADVLDNYGPGGEVMIRISAVSASALESSGPVAAASMPANDDEVVEGEIVE